MQRQLTNVRLDKKLDKENYFAFFIEVYVPPQPFYDSQ